MKNLKRKAIITLILVTLVVLSQITLGANNSSSSSSKSSSSSSKSSSSSTSSSSTKTDTTDSKSQGVNVSGNTSVKVGSTTKLTLNNYTGGGTIIWESSDTSIATVSGGTVTGIKEGTVTIRTKFSGATISTTVTVTDDKSSSKSNNNSTKTDNTDSESKGVNVSGNTTVRVGGTTTLTLNNYTGGGTIIWESSDTSIATVSGGVVTGIKEGTVTIRTKFSGATITTTVTVTASGTGDTPGSAKLESVKLSYPSDVMAVGQTQKATVSYVPQNASGTITNFTSSKPGIVTVDSQGNITAKKESTTSVEIFVNVKDSSGKKYSASYTISKVVADESEITSGTSNPKITCPVNVLKMPTDKTSNFSLTVTPANTAISISATGGYGKFLSYGIVGGNNNGKYTISVTSKTVKTSSPIILTIKAGRAVHFVAVVIGLEDSVATSLSFSSSQYDLYYLEGKGDTDKQRVLNLRNQLVIKPETANIKMKYSIDNTDAATLSGYIVTAKDPGNSVKTVKLTATDEFSGLKASTTINIKKTSATGIVLDKTQVAISSKEKVKITATLKGELEGQNKEKDIEWTISNRLSSTGDKKGKQIEVYYDEERVGYVFEYGADSIECIVTAKYGEYSATANVSVIRPDFVKIKSFTYNDMSKFNMSVGQSLSPTLKWDPVNSMPDGGYVFTSSDPSKVTVSSDGTITAIAPTDKNQSVKITVTATNKNKTYSDSVTISKVDKEIPDPTSWKISGVPNLIVIGDNINYADEIPNNSKYADCVESFSFGESGITMVPENANVGEIAIEVTGTSGIISVNGLTIKALKVGDTKIKVTNKTYPNLKAITVNIHVIGDLSVDDIFPVESYTALVGTTISMSQLGVNNNKITMAGLASKMTNNGTSITLGSETGTAVVNYYKAGDKKEISGKKTTVHIKALGFKSNKYTLDASKTEALNLGEFIKTPQSELSNGAKYSMRIIEGGDIATIDSSFMLRPKGNGNGTVTVSLSASGTGITATTSVEIKGVKMNEVNVKSSYTGQVGETIGVAWFVDGPIDDWIFDGTQGIQYVSYDDKQIYLKQSTEDLKTKSVTVTIKNTKYQTTYPVTITVLGKYSFKLNDKDVKFDFKEGSGTQQKSISYSFNYGSDASLSFSQINSTVGNEISIERGDNSFIIVVTGGEQSETLTFTVNVIDYDQIVESDSATITIIGNDEYPVHTVPSSATITNISKHGNQTSIKTSEAKSYKSMDSKIASVDAQGTITGKAAGTTQVIGYSKSGSKGDEVVVCEVTVVAPAVSGGFTKKVGETISASSVISNASQIERLTGETVIVRPHKNDGKYLSMSGNTITVEKYNSNPKNIVVKLSNGSSEVLLAEVPVKIVE